MSWFTDWLINAYHRKPLTAQEEEDISMSPAPFATQFTRELLGRVGDVNATGLMVNAPTPANILRGGRPIIEAGAHMGMGVAPAITSFLRTGTIEPPKRPVAEVAKPVEKPKPVPAPMATPAATDSVERTALPEFVARGIPEDLVGRTAPLPGGMPEPEMGYTIHGERTNKAFDPLTGGVVTTRPGDGTYSDTTNDADLQAFNEAAKKFAAGESFSLGGMSPYWQQRFETEVMPKFDPTRGYNLERRAAFEDTALKTAAAQKLAEHKQGLEIRQILTFQKMAREAVLQGKTEDQWVSDAALAILASKWNAPEMKAQLAELSLPEQNQLKARLMQESEAEAAGALQTQFDTQFNRLMSPVRTQYQYRGDLNSMLAPNILMGG